MPTMNPGETVRSFFFAFSFLIIPIFFSGCSKSEDKRILVFSKTAGFEHESIPAGIKAIQKLGAEHDFVVDPTTQSSVFTEDNLKHYDAVVFLNTTGDVLDYKQQAEFERYIQAGGGFVGIHAAADTEYSWPWYGKLVGGYFESHPKVQAASIIVDGADHVSTAHLPEKWERTDEWYNYKDLNPDINVLARLDESSYKGGTNGENHPIAWYHEYDGGRAFYTGGGHTDESFAEPAFLEHLLQGILWAAGGEEPDYDKVTTQRVPEELRFMKETLATDLNEPTELAVLDDGRVLLIERRGGIKLYDPSTNETSLVGELAVHTEEEDGLMGLAVDPNFEENNWVYMYYSPAGPKAVNVLSRFVLEGGKIDMSSEIKMLEVPVQREECCHTGGSIAFDAEGNLFLSTGDNTNPFASNGFAPIDGRPGRKAWDARRTAGNTDDLRGKILRIHPEADGTYTIPEGNLFTENDSPEGRPEIYVMGNRNPYRITVDPKTGFLYWGEVGPDAARDSIQGPMGYDEVNQARAAGNFGWPFLIGDNIPYNRWNFATEEAGAAFDAANPINDSPHNSGASVLPPAQEAFIWYPYLPSEEFPLVGEGGRTAMAGPVYNEEMYQESGKNFPDYYDGKLFIYEWMRNWIMAVTMDEQGDFLKMEPFLPNMEFHRPMDMHFGPDGAMYLLEYGQDWFSKNPNAQLVRIEYSEDNRLPSVRATVEKSQGKAPFKTRFSAADSFDHDEEDSVSYAWYFTGDQVQSTAVAPTYTFEEPGKYEVILEVTDSKGATARRKLEVVVGKPAASMAGKEEQGHQTAPVIDSHPGKILIENSDCRACHAVDKVVVGPSYLQIAARYKDDVTAKALLRDNIIEGTRGNWGDRPMAPHPQLSKEDVEKMVEYILSLEE